MPVKSYSQNNEGSTNKALDKSINKMLRPNLFGHNFSITSQTKSPFTGTYLQMNMGIGQTVGLDLPQIQIDSNIIVTGRVGSITLTDLKIEYQAKLNNWLAFWLNYEIYGRLGTQPRTIFSQGINISTGYEFGWLFKLYEDKRSLLSGSISATNTSYTILNLSSFIKKVIENGGLTPDNKIVQTIPSLSVVAGLRYAYAFNKSFGLIALLEGGSGESLNKTDGDKFILNGGATFDYDLLPASNVPIGFSLGYYQNTFSILSEEKISTPQNIIAQISYTGKPDLNLGIEFFYAWAKSSFTTSISNYEKTLQFYRLQGNLIYYF